MIKVDFSSFQSDNEFQQQCIKAFMEQERDGQNYFV